MVPAATTIDVGPVLDLARFRDQQRDPIGVERMRRLAIDLDGPREGCRFGAIGCALTRRRIARITVAGPAEFDDPGAYRRDDRDLLGEYVWHLARVIVAATVGNGQHLIWRIGARHRAHDPKLHDGTDRGIVGTAGQRLR